MKATHYGTCQICGRKQKAPHSLMAKHGYTVDGGYFNGTCFGSDEKPFELDRSVLGQEMLRLSKNITKRTEHLAKVKTGKEPVLATIRFRHPEDKWGYRSEKAWVRIKNFEDDGSIVIDKNNAPFLKNTLDQKEPDPIYHPNTKVNEDGDWVIMSKGCDWKYRYFAWLDRRLELMKKLLKDMEARYNSWEKKELEPVEEVA